VLDEPTAGLDPATRAELLDVVRGQAKLRGAGTSVVMVSHDLDEVGEVADRVCVLEGGEVRAVGPAEEVFYASPGAAPAPATVRTISLLRDSYPELGRPVRFEETLGALRSLLGA
jgi:ABC-type multidrug transport system ATPase subunit